MTREERDRLRELAVTHIKSLSEVTRERPLLVHLGDAFKAGYSKGREARDWEVEQLGKNVQHWMEESFKWHKRSMDERAQLAASEQARERLVKAIQASIDDCPYGCVGGDCAAEWEMEPKPCSACIPLREALAEDARKEGL